MVEKRSDRVDLIPMGGAGSERVMPSLRALEERAAVGGPLAKWAPALSGAEECLPNGVSWS